MRSGVRGGGALAVAQQRRHGPRTRPLARAARGNPDRRHESVHGVARRYDARVGIEPSIGAWTGAWGIGQVPSRGFDANHATLLLKLLVHNLLRRYVLRDAPALQRWRAPRLRRALLAVPGRLVRPGRCWTLRLAPRPTPN
ncbi:MAG TPA: transposase [Polyangiaceae bacterium]|nr:transposase [Polyangiaceae bacterium]